MKLVRDEGWCAVERGALDWHQRHKQRGEGGASASDGTNIRAAKPTTVKRIVPPPPKPFKQHRASPVMSMRKLPVEDAFLRLATLDLWGRGRLYCLRVTHVPYGAGPFPVRESMGP